MDGYRLDVIRMRTDNEIKAYYDGYCACDDCPYSIANNFEDEWEGVEDE